MQLLVLEQECTQLAAEKVMQYVLQSLHRYGFFSNFRRTLNYACFWVVPRTTFFFGNGTCMKGEGEEKKRERGAGRGKGGDGTEPSTLGTIPDGLVFD